MLPSDLVHIEKDLMQCKMVTSYTNNILLTLGFALEIVRVQYRFFIGTVAKRSPEKLDPFPFFTGLGNAQIINYQFVLRQPQD